MSTWPDAIIRPELTTTTPIGSSFYDRDRVVVSELMDLFSGLSVEDKVLAMHLGFQHDSNYPIVELPIPGEARVCAQNRKMIEQKLKALDLMPETYGDSEVAVIARALSNAYGDFWYGNSS